MEASMEAKEQQIKLLEEELEKSKNEGARAAEIGMKLLQTNEDLRQQIEKDGKAYGDQIESLQQEVHSLNLKLEMHARTKDAFEEEIRLVKADTEVSCSQRISLLEQNHTAKVNQLNLHIEELKNELTLREEQVERCKIAISEKDSEIRNLKDSLANQTNTSLLPLGQISDLQRCIVRLEQDCSILMDDVEKKSAAVQEANEEKEIYQSKISELEQVLKEKERVSFEWYQSLKEAQEEITIVRGRLEQSRVKTLQDDWQSQGNSLFGEVEDRRLQTERDLIKYKVKYQSLERSHQTLLQSYKKLKMDFTALLCRHSSTAADADHVQRLQRTLSQRNSELEDLNEKLSKLEKQKSVATSVSHDYANAFVDFGDKKEYIQYLEHEQEEMKEQLSHMQRELNLKSTQLIWECKKLTESEAKLHKAEKDKAKFMNDSCKMKLKLQEALEKQGNEREHVRSLEKEIELLKKQLQGKIKTGQTFSGLEQEKPKKPTQEELDQSAKEHKKKKRPPARKTINLLEELQKATDSVPDNTSPAVVIAKPSEISKHEETKSSTANESDHETLVASSPESVSSTVSTLRNQSSDSVEDKENCADHHDLKEGVSSLPFPADYKEPEKVHVKRVKVHKTIKAADSKAKMDEQCRQQ